MNDRRRARRDGAILLEVLVALAVLGTVGSAAAWNTAETLRAVSRVHEREENVRAAQRLLSAISLWPREDLDRHLGSRPQGAWMVRVDRVSSDLYEIVLQDTASGRRVLRTALMRVPEADQ